MMLEISLGRVGSHNATGDGRDAHDSGYRCAGVRNELLGAVDHPVAVLQPRARARVAGIGARLRLGQPERAEPFAGAQLRHQFALLLLRAEHVNRLRAQRGMRAQRDRDRRVHPRELLDGQCVGERVAAATAVLLRERDAHQVQLAELRDDLIRERLRAVELLGHRRDLALGEFPDRAPDQLMVGGKVEVHGGESLRVRSGACRHSRPAVR